MTYYLGMRVMAVFAVTGVVVPAAKKDMDIFTIVILGGVTAIGGGTLRDIILDVSDLLDRRSDLPLGRDNGLHRCLFPNPKNQQGLQAAGICRWPRGGNVLGAGNGKKHCYWVSPGRWQC